MYTQSLLGVDEFRIRFPPINFWQSRGIILLAELYNQAFGRQQPGLKTLNLL